MKMIYYKGLNCHLAGIVNIAASLYSDYLNIFYNLWSETDFTDDTEYNLYTSKRVFENLRSFGFIIRKLKCTNERETKEVPQQIRLKELFLVGMDTFYIPWHPVYQHFHGPHYFYAQKSDMDRVSCFDPIYKAENIEMRYADICFTAFELNQILKRPVIVPKIEITQEALQVIQNHPKIQKNILSELENCKSEKQKDVTTLIKQVTAMINNRYLYKQFIRQFLPVSAYANLFSKAYFARWEAVRNGLYKFSIVKNNESVADEISVLFTALIQEELAMAESECFKRT